MENWLFASFDILLKTALSAGGILLLALLAVRIYGLRSFAKMSSVDFASTIAFGTVLASVVMNTGQSLAKGGVAMLALVGFQLGFSYLKRKSDRLAKIVENNPTYLMWEGEILHDHLEKTGISHADLMAKLREANVWDFKQVKAAVFETTGDVSVLHGDNWRDMTVDDEILRGIVPDPSEI